MEVYIVVLMITVVSCHGFPASSVQRSGRMTPNSHPMLASVFNVMNAVRDISQGASFAFPKTSPNIVKSHPDVAALKPLSAAVHPGSTQVKPLLEHAAPTESDSNRGIVASLGDMQCGLCRRMNDPECIKKLCWVEPAQTILVAPNTVSGVSPAQQGQLLNPMDQTKPGPVLNVMGQSVMPDPALSVMGQNVVPGPALNVMGQNVMPGQAVNVMGQNVMPDPALSVMGQNVMPGPALNVMGQNVMPGQALNVMEQNVIPDKALNVMGQNVVPDQALNVLGQNAMPDQALNVMNRKPGPTLSVMGQSGASGPALGAMDQNIMSGPVMGVAGQIGIQGPTLGLMEQGGMSGPALGIMQQDGMPDPALGVMQQGAMPGSAVGEMVQSGIADPALGVIGQSGVQGPTVGVIEQSGISGPAFGVMDQSQMLVPAVNAMQQKESLMPVSVGVDRQDVFVDLWPPAVSSGQPVVKPRLKNAVNPPIHVAPVPVVPASNPPATTMFAVPRGMDALINMQASLPSNQAVPAQQPSEPQQLNPMSTATVQSNPTNFVSGMQVSSSDASMHQRQGLDLVQNTLVDHPIKTIPGGDSMFETHVDKIQKVHIGSQGLPNTVTGGHVQAPLTNGQTSVALMPSNVPIQMNQHSGQPLPDRPITGHMGSNVRPSVPTANDIFGSVETVVTSRPATPAVAVASDVFGGSVGMSGAADGGDRHTLVLKQHRGGGNKVGIVIGDTDPSSRMLSVLETSGQMPEARPNPQPQPSVGSESVFVPLSSVNLAHQHGAPAAGQHTPSGAHTLNDQSRMVPLNSVNPGGLPAGLGMAAGPPAMLSSPVSGGTQPGPVPGNPDLIFPPGFVESVLSSTTPLPTMNPVRKAEIHSWGSQFLPTNSRP